jgi:hypothetical protein
MISTAQIAKDFSATSLIGPLATGGQLMNASVMSYLYQLVSNLEYSLPGFAPKMQEILKPTMDVSNLVQSLVNTAADMSSDSLEFKCILAQRTHSMLR